MLVPIYAIYVEKIGGDILAASGAYAVFSLVYGVLMIFFGRLTDRVKESEYFIVAGFLLSGVGFFGYMVVQNPLQLFIVQAVLGIALALMTPAHDSLYTAHLDHGRFASEWGTWEAVYWITEGIAAFVGGLIVTYVSFDALFMFMGGISFVAGFYIWILPRRVL